MCVSTHFHQKYIQLAAQLYTSVRHLGWNTAMGTHVYLSNAVLLVVVCTLVNALESFGPEAVRSSAVCVHQQHVRSATIDHASLSTTAPTTGSCKL